VENSQEEKGLLTRPFLFAHSADDAAAEPDGHGMRAAPCLQFGE
jgi:hypothetical protein